MRPWQSRIAREARSDSGFTWVELLVAMVLALGVGAAALTFMVVTLHEQNNISSRSVATNQAESGLEQLVRDLREAMTSVSVTNPSGPTTQIQFYIPTPGSDATGELVSWTCPSVTATTLGSCTRALTANGSTTTKSAITGVQSMSFAPVSNTNTALSLPVTTSTTVASVGMTLKVAITGYGIATSTVTTPIAGAATAPIVLNATADLRNFQ